MSARDAFKLLRSRLAEPLVLIDAGARWGAIPHWNLFAHHGRIYCFEADADEAARLNRERTGSHIEYVPLALASNELGRDLTITEGIGCSSTLEPVPALYERYPGCAIMRPVRKVACPSISLDRFCEQRGVSRVHAIKLDTQGGELDILRGAERMLQTCLFANVEVEFNVLYEGQPLFCDVDRFMRDRGFVLWRLDNLAHYSTGIVGEEASRILISVEPGSHEHVPTENGQLFWGDAFYVRATATAASPAALAPDEAVATACLVSQWGFWDLALEAIGKSGDAKLLRRITALVPPGRPIAKLSYQVELLQKREQEWILREKDLLQEIAGLRKRLLLG